ncbi:uncharacterized protein DSM5745_01696 [Aspergillus mulundensis]|uniref:Uncharacterized protein n=1 Tax=Aspergillus mulundensis TaxID=1810919 RepID=A0A3D8SUR8_9EURO|nr:hypothetical protein DSM5745_01696 [Aspergillus mulundensis]RDW89921.1 hypothetical protein DSM5745_01696 [Aspergillus mulundensis]
MPPLRRCEANKRAQPVLGAESPGVLYAADGQWFVGVGRVVALGVTYRLSGPEHLRVYVEPVPGKSGGDYDFFHPVTREWMDELPQTNPVPGVECTRHQRKSLPNRWRDLPAITRRPKLGEEYPGRYFPPKAPKRFVYVGVGKVVKTGVDEGRIWAEVEPIPGKTGGKYEFFDPWTGQDMPADYWPGEEEEWDKQTPNHTKHANNAAPDPEVKVVRRQTRRARPLGIQKRRYRHRVAEIEADVRGAKERGQHEARAEG